MSKLKYWFYHVLIAVDQLLNAVCGGAADETFSSRCYRGAVLAKKPKKRWRVIHKIVETLFFWEKGSIAKLPINQNWNASNIQRNFGQWITLKPSNTGRYRAILEKPKVSVCRRH